MKVKYLSKITLIILLIVVLMTVVWYGLNIAQNNRINQLISEQTPSIVETIPANKRTTPDLILLGARKEVENGTRYDGSYQIIAYPGGDVAPDRGACTDVVIRAFRRAGIDLQELIHNDMKENFSLYPNNWGLDSPDPNIDHRRIPNQITFFKRHGLELSTEVHGNLKDWKWGDVVYWQFPNGDEHCGIISDRTNKDNIPLVIHNSSVAREEDCLLRWKITGHYRYPIPHQ